MTYGEEKLSDINLIKALRYFIGLSWELATNRTAEYQDVLVCADSMICQAFAEGNITQEQSESINEAIELLEKEKISSEDVENLRNKMISAGLAPFAFLNEITPPSKVLVEIAKNNPPPESWIDDENDNPFIR